MFYQVHSGIIQQVSLCNSHVNTFGVLKQSWQVHQCIRFYFADGQSVIQSLMRGGIVLPEKCESSRIISQIESIGFISDLHILPAGFAWDDITKSHAIIKN